MYNVPCQICGENESAHDNNVQECGKDDDVVGCFSYFPDPEYAKKRLNNSKELDPKEEEYLHDLCRYDVLSHEKKEEIKEVDSKITFKELYSFLS